MATLEFKPPQTAGAEPELNLLMPKGSEQSLWGSLVQNVKDTFFPQELPPLVLTSKPVPVKDIWGFYSYKKSGATLSTITHILVLAAILLGTYYLGKKVAEEPKKEVVTLIAPNLDVPAQVLPLQLMPHRDERAPVQKHFRLAISHKQEDADGGKPVREIGQQIHRGIIGPMQIVQKKH